MRKRRFDEGALSLSSVRLTFKLDEAGYPIECQPYQQKESNRLIEEFMLLANASVAKKIAVTYPEHALLRRHAPPLMNRLVSSPLIISFITDHPCRMNFLDYVRH
jgi:protein SSD1